MNPLQQAMENRISRRSYTGTPIEPERVTQISALIATMNDASQLSAVFVEDGSAAFDSLKKSYGMFNNVRSLIAMKGFKNDDHLQEKVGYYGELLMLQLVDLGLGTCWVGGTYDAQKVVTLAEDEALICVIVVGIVDDAPSTKENSIRTLIRRNVKPLEERLIAPNDTPPWVLSGMQAVLLAPSAINAQKTLFTYKDGQLTVSTVVEGKFDLIDLGIAKKHFELGAGGHFALGNDALFHQDV